MNPDVLKAGLEVGLEAFDALDGRDYLYRELGGEDDWEDQVYPVIITRVDGQGSPASLEAPALIVIYLDSAWRACIQVPCTSTREAISTLVEMSAING